MSPRGVWRAIRTRPVGGGGGGGPARWDEGRRAGRRIIHAKCLKIDSARTKGVAASVRPSVVISPVPVPLPSAPPARILVQNGLSDGLHNAHTARRDVVILTRARDGGQGQSREILQVTVAGDVSSYPVRAETSAPHHAIFRHLFRGRWSLHVLRFGTITAMAAGRLARDTVNNANAITYNIYIVRIYDEFTTVLVLFIL